jgi:hypothetical protein
MIRASRGGTSVTAESDNRKVARIDAMVAMELDPRMRNSSQVRIVDADVPPPKGMSTSCSLYCDVLLSACVS